MTWNAVLILEYNVANIHTYEQAKLFAINIIPATWHMFVNYNSNVVGWKLFGAAANLQKEQHRTFQLC